MGSGNKTMKIRTFSILVLALALQLNLLNAFTAEAEKEAKQEEAVVKAEPTAAQIAGNIEEAYAQSEYWIERMKDTELHTQRYLKKCPEIKAKLVDMSERREDSEPLL